MFFNRLCKRVMCFSLASLLVMGSFLIAGVGVDSARAEDVVDGTSSATLKLFGTNKVMFNELGVHYDLALECFDDDGYIKPGSIKPIKYTIGKTIIEVGFDSNLSYKEADGLVDFESTVTERGDKAYVINVIKNFDDGRSRFMIPNKDYKVTVKDTSENKQVVTLSNVANEKDNYSFTIDLVDTAIGYYYRNSSVCKSVTSKLFESKKAVSFSLSGKDDSFVSRNDFIKANENNMIDSGNYDVFYKDFEGNKGKARIIINKYRIKKSDVKWDSKAWAKFDYTGKAISPKVLKVELSKSSGLVGVKDITSSEINYEYYSYDANNILKKVDKCVDIGKYIVWARFGSDIFKNIYFPEYTVDLTNEIGFIPFEITKSRPSIKSAKVEVKKATYNRANQKAVVTKVTLGGKTLKAGVDYTVSNVVKKNAGSYDVKITGKGNYIGSITKKFVIAKKSILKCIFVKEPKMTIDGNTVLKKGKDFKCVKKNNKMYIIGIGNYTGTKVFNIAVKKTKKK